MIVLGITTSTEQSGVALMKDGALLGEKTFSGARSCVEELIPKIDALLKESGGELGDLDLIGVDVGPGGMTGLKIGVVTAKTLGQTADVKLAAVSSTLTICEGSDAPRGAFMLTVLKCMKKEFFTALYKIEQSGVARIFDEKLVDRAGLEERVRAALPGPLHVLGDAAGHVHEIITALAPDAIFTDGPANFPSAANVCRLALAANHVSFNEIVPNYLCLSNAERAFGITV